MKLALILSDNDRADLHAPHGLCALLRKRGEELSKRGREPAEVRFLQPMGECSGGQVFGDSLWRLLSSSFAPQRAKVLDTELRNAIEFSVEIRDNWRERRLPASGRPRHGSGSGRGV
jgi:hypothetical protein